MSTNKKEMALDDKALDNVAGGLNQRLEGEEALIWTMKQLRWDKTDKKYYDEVLQKYRAKNNE